MRRLPAQDLSLMTFLGCLAWLTVGLAGADGRVFLLEPRPGSHAGFLAALDACAAQGARVASRSELRHAVVECSFSACARGWLTGPSIGTTVCRSVAGSFRAVEMQVENATESSERLPVFCVKDTGAPCGSPPSFPNTRIQGQRGLELGDEVLYSCSPGYMLPRGETGFSLLCDSCGKWYGLVQLCVKADTEAFIDYEDKLPDDDHFHQGLGEVHHLTVVPRVTEIFDHEESTPELEPKQKGPVMVEEEGTDKEDSRVSVTENPVSQLSQKHMFWFPSETFEEEKHALLSTATPINGPTKDENYILSKTDKSLSETEIKAEDHDSKLSPQPPTYEPARHSVGSTKESWLDGYPVPQEEEKTGTMSSERTGPGQTMDTGSVTGGSEMQVLESVTDRPERTGMAGIIPSYQEEETKSLSESPERQDFGKVNDYQENLETESLTESTEGTGYWGVFNQQGGELQKVTDKLPDQVSDHTEETHIVTKGPTIEQTEGEAKRPIEVEFEDVNDRFKEMPSQSMTDSPNDVEMSPTSFISFTQISAGHDDSALNERPTPYTPGAAPENVSSSQEGIGFERTATPTGMPPVDTKSTQKVHIISNVATPTVRPTVSAAWETKDFGHFLEYIPTVGGDTSVKTHDNRSAMEGDTELSLDHPEGSDKGACGVDPCHVAGRGVTIAGIIIGVLVAVLGAILGVWCYKRRQQKSSHYQLNGTNRQTQCIELRQTV
ncbi:sushi domain-containing protein 5 [Electrophorus electricus]|uniref:sushi domain-containing protein 5 n=1 Tax=Electrophorus electricus TaxID=8005 RepID=UPI0015CFDE93|nr:sushi domain-containing protein 5 [Electrophorus electricus]